MDTYLPLVASLKEELTKVQGFIRVERFSSLGNERKLLSLSVWESEQAINQWRNEINTGRPSSRGAIQYLRVIPSLWQKHCGFAQIRNGKKPRKIRRKFLTRRNHK